MFLRGTVPPVRQRVDKAGWEKVEKIKHRFEIAGDLLIFKSGQSRTTVVPDLLIPGSGKALHTHLIWFAHEGDVLSGHRGMTGTCETLRRTFYWPRMDYDCYRYIASCEGCLLVKADSRQASGTFTSRYLSHINELLLTDFAGPFEEVVSGDGKWRYVLLLVDAYSGYCLLRPCHRKDSATVASEILNWCSLFGTPESWTHDSDPAFVGLVSTALRRLIGLGPAQSPTYSPMSQGTVERLVRTMKTAISAFAESHAISGSDVSWTMTLRGIQWSQNSSKHACGVSGFQLMLGREPRDLLNAAFTEIHVDAPQSDDHNEYMAQLGKRLEEIRSYWTSRSNEMKCVQADNRADCVAVNSDLLTGQLCFRISYVSHQRTVHGKVVVVSKCGTNSYQVRDHGVGSDSTPYLCHGYQLIPILGRESINFGPDGPTRAQQSDVAHGERLREVRSVLRTTPVGTTVASIYHGEILVGELLEPFVRGTNVTIMFYRSVGNQRFVRPVTDKQFARATEVTPIAEVVKVGVLIDDDGYVNFEQFGGSVL